ncbi:MAG TPA: transglycosylase SLT domain-containing protein [Syntrophorhabdaceae bacterium]|jgi:membrane-bound lytic murein transglycosylase D
MNERRKTAIRFLIALSLMFMTVSCASYSQSDGVRVAATVKSPEPGASSSSGQIPKGGAEATVDAGLRASGKDNVVVEDIGTPPPGMRKPRTSAKVVSSDPAGGEENIPFRDLPGIPIDERLLTKSTTVGHDALIEKELKRLLGEFGDKGTVETIFLNEVKLYVKAFQTNDQYRRFMNASLRRSARYMPAVKEVFRKRNIPEDMAFIAFLESGFNPNARSHAGAVGMWQFMPGTARQYSLRVADRTDERLDPVKSTFAAVEYFHDLIAIFGPRSFLLALAAYNCGEGRIIGCLKKINNPMEERNFWHIRSCLARETREYPPKVIAAAVIGSNPETFGFPRYEGNGESLEIRTAFANFRSLEESAPEARPVHVEPVRKAKEGAKPVRVAIAAKPKPPEPKPPEPKPILYVVKKGNTIVTVAEIFRVEKEDIKKWNKLRSLRVEAGQKLKIYPAASMEAVSYKVKKGDTITEICRSLKVRPATLIAANGLKNGYTIKQGQVLVVYRVKGKAAAHRA